MTLPSSGPLSLSDIQGEFGGSNPISLSEYYAGGAYVPAGTSGTYGAVPTGGAISIRNFYGTSKIITETHTLVPGTTYSKYSVSRGFIDGIIGTISPTTFGFLSNAPITQLDYNSFSFGVDTVSFSIVGNFSNSGWTSVSVNGTTFTRASGSFSTGSGSTGWSWSVTSDPFGADGTSNPVVFTQ